MLVSSFKLGCRLLLAALRDTIRRTLYDVYSAYFLPEVMVKSWKRVSGTHRYNNDNNNPLFNNDMFQSSKLKACDVVYKSN